MKTSKVILGFAAACLMWAVGATALAQTSVTSDEEARALFQAGRVAYSSGRFDQALKHFEEAYRLSGRSLLLLNIANCHDRLRHDREALSAFEEFVRLNPDSPEIETAQARIEFLRNQLEDEQEAAPKVATPEEAAAQANAEDESASVPEAAPDRRDGEPRSKKGWIWGTVGGVVAAGLIVGIAVAVSGGSSQTEDPIDFDMNTRTRGL